jgi:glucosamine--fructose-6-phosphate aminotransferase (isomerizing)
MSSFAASHLHREIHEQPDVVARVISEQRAPVHALARAIAGRKISHVVIAARGTSDNAARYAQYALGARNQLLVGLATPSLFTTYGATPQFRDALVLGISQSGASPDIVAVIAEARRQGALTAVLTNNVTSDLARQGDVVIDLSAGEEKAVAATKTYTASLAVIALLSASLEGDPAAHEALSAVPAAMRETLAAAAPAMAAHAERFRDVERSVVVGRGFNYATAFELALKLKELTYTVVEPYSSADFLHGPLALIEPGFPVIVVAPSGRMLEEMRQFVATVRANGAEVACVSDEATALEAAQVPIAVPRAVPEWLSPLTMILPGQLLALHLAAARGYDVDAPRGIRKITRTR